MDFDQIFVIGLALIAFSIPSAVSARSDRRWPKTAFLMLVLGVGGIVFAVRENPGVYSPSTVDDVIVSVIGGMVNN